MRLFKKTYDSPADENIDLQNNLLDAKYFTYQGKTFLFGSLTCVSCLVAVLLFFMVACVLTVLFLYFADNGDILGMILHHYWPKVFPPVLGW